ncbi:hypothetical protein EMCRGX_G007322 [Ephydatia muelleri]
MSLSSTSEPREPLVLRYQLSDQWKISKMTEELSEHIVPKHVNTSLPFCSSGDRPLCAYFYYYYNHYKGCNVKTTVCNQCCKVLRWIEHHARTCKSLTLEGCFEICTKMKERRFRLSSRIHSEDLDDITSKGDKDSDTSSGASSGSFTYPATPTCAQRQPSVTDSVDVFPPSHDLELEVEAQYTPISHRDISSQDTRRSSQDTPHSSQDTLPFPQDTPPLPQDTPCLSLDTVSQPTQDSVPQSSSTHPLVLESIRERFEPDEEKMEEEVAAREVNHRAHTRQCLLKQLRRHGGYCENVHWVRVNKIASGGFGTCFSILDNESNYLLAMKEGNIDFHAEDAGLDETYICLKLARLINSKPLHVVEFFGANIIPFPHHTTVQLFEELMSSSLYDLLKHNGPLIADDVIHYSYQMFDALDFLHTKLMMVHCDIKPANLLLDVTNQRLKVADFGSAVLMRECNYGPVFSGSPGAGTLHFNPPEFYRDQTCSRAFDIWQAGCCMLNMCTGRRPWRHLYMDSINPSVKCHQRYMIGQQSTHIVPSFLNEGLQRLLCDCLHSDYKCRPTAQQCQNMLVALEGDHVKRSVDKVMRAESISSLDSSADYAASTYTSQTGTTITNRLDVYVCTEICYCNQFLKPGWMGSIECPKTLFTPDQLWQYLETSLPVVKQLPPNCTIATCDHTPSTIWQGLKHSDCLPMEVWNLVSRRSPIAIGWWRT